MAKTEKIKITWKEFKKWKEAALRRNGLGDDSFVYGTRKGIKCEFTFGIFRSRSQTDSKVVEAVRAKDQFVWVCDKCGDKYPRPYTSVSDIPCLKCKDGTYKLNPDYEMIPP